MATLTPFIWLEKDALGSVRYYRSIFGESNVTIHGEEHFEDTPSGPVQIVTADIFGTTMRFMSAGPHQEHTDMISLEVLCADQAEVDRYWNGLTADGGKESQCGWCKDKFGISWQIVPKRFVELMSDPDPEKSGRVMQAMLQMKKLDVAALERAHQGF